MCIALPSMYNIIIGYLGAQEKSLFMSQMAKPIILFIHMV